MGLSHLFYGVVDTAEYKTRKGNMPGRLTAESETTSPNYLLGEYSLKQLGTTKMNQLKRFRLAIPDPFNGSFTHQDVFAFTQKQALASTIENTVIVSWEPANEGLCYSKSLEKNVPLALLFNELQTYRQKYTHNQIEVSHLLGSHHFNANRYGNLQAQKINMLSQIMSVIDVNLNGVKGVAAND